MTQLAQSPTLFAPPGALAPRIVAAMILKNEAKGIEAVMESARDLVDAFVVVDTGSTDGTPEIVFSAAVRLGKGLYLVHDPWDDDFARSRNVGLDALDRVYPDAEWVAILDGDDRVEGAKALREQLIGLSDGAVALPEAVEGIPREDGPPVPPFLGIRVDSPTAGGKIETFLQVRIFWRGAGIRYQYPVHAVPDTRLWTGADEDVFAADTAARYRGVAVEDCRILHLGYADPAHWRENQDRTLRILRAKLLPNDLYRLAYEARALIALQRWDEALPTAQALLRACKGRPSAEAFSFLVKALVGLADEALRGDDDEAIAHVLDDLVDAARAAVRGIGVRSTALDVWIDLLSVALRGTYLAADAVLTGVEQKINTTLPLVPSILRAGTALGLFPISEVALEMAEEQALRAGGGPPKPPPVEAALGCRKPIPPDDPFLLRVPPDLRGKKTGLRVLIVAAREIAGQGVGLLRTLNAHTAHAARLVVYENDHIAYPGQDIVLGHGEGPRGSRVLIPDGDGIEEAQKLVERAEFFHFILMPPPDDVFGWSRRIHRRNALVQHLGSQLRDNPTIIEGWHRRTGILGLSAWDWTMFARSPMAYHIPLLCDVGEMGRAVPYGGPGVGPFRVAHPTTNRAFKGTDVLIEAVERANECLAARGALPGGTAPRIELDIIEGVSNEECLQRKRLCHATFDQLSVGIHGLSAVESMAMGHVVFGGISAWARSIRPEVPIVPVDGVESLAEALVLYASDPLRARDVGTASLRWAFQTHGLHPVSRRFTALYAHIVGGNTPITTAVPATIP